MKKVLTIAGSDCSGGAGIQADLKTMSAHGVFGMSVIVSVVAEKLREYRPQNVVIDPVMYAKNGCPLMDPGSIDRLIQTILPLADLLTPNIPEAEKIAGMEIRSLADMERAAQAIQAMGPKGVLVKGGHAVGDAVDVLYDGQAFHHYATQRIDTKNTHGTGCTYSSAIASNLALGHPMDEAVRLAKGYVTTAIRHSLAFGQGCGPTHHFWDLYRNGLTTNADLIG